MTRISLSFTDTTPGSGTPAFASTSFAPVEAERAGAVTCWTLQGGQAMRFTASAPGTLRVAYGRIWLTFTHPGHFDSQGRVQTRSSGAPRDDDFMLQTGQSVRLATGESVVFEPFAIPGTADAGLQWRGHGGAE